MDWKEAAELTRKLKRNGSSDSTLTEIVIGAAAVFLFIVLLGIPLAIYAVWANALAIKVMWGWFIVTTFGLEPLSWAQAWGVSLLIAYMTHVSVTWKAEDTRSTAARIGEIIASLIKPWIALGIGYICAHWFMHVV